jgi:hypothetical protein
MPEHGELLRRLRGECGMAQDARSGADNRCGPAACPARDVGTKRDEPASAASRTPDGDLRMTYEQLNHQERSLGVSVARITDELPQQLHDLSRRQRRDRKLAESRQDEGAHRTGEFISLSPTHLLQECPPTVKGHLANRRLHIANLGPAGRRTESHGLQWGSLLCGEAGAMNEVRLSIDPQDLALVCDGLEYALVMEALTDLERASEIYERLNDALIASIET